MIDSMTIIDGHVHTFSSPEVSEKILGSFNCIYTIEFENPGTGTVDDVLENMDRVGIDFTIMANFAPPKIIHRNNLWTINTAKENKSLIPLVSFHPDMGGELCSYLESYIKEGAKGIKMHPMAQAFPPDHPRLNNVYQFCNENRFPVVFHCGRVANARLNSYSDLESLEPVIKKYPDIPVVLTHMVDGSRSDVERLSKEYGNVYFDTSIVITGYLPILKTNRPSWRDDGYVIDVINEIGAERLIFGSDYPWGNPSDDLRRFMGLKLGRQKLEAILGKNALKLFRIDK